MLPKMSLENTANDIRQDIIQMLVTAGSGHSAGSLGLADIFTTLYFGLLNHNPKQSQYPDRDRLILSCGHVCPVLYATLARAGYFPKEELKTLRQLHSRLQGHPSLHSLPGVENSSGPLGQGVSIAAGLAMGGKLNGEAWRVVCITSDGEQDEGQVWESYLFAAKYHLDNLTFILDRNDIQIDGFTHEVMPIEPLRKKLESFGLFVLEINGHDFDEIQEAYLKSKVIHNQPTMIIAHTIPGKGVSFMENDPRWHGKPPNKNEALEALKELKTFF